MLEQRGEDLGKIRTYRNLGLLKDVDPEVLYERCNKGCIIVACSDRDQTPDFLQHFNSHVKCVKQPHQKLIDGGAIRIVEAAPILKEFRIHDQLIAEIVMDRQLKKIPTLLLCTHYPCSMAEKSKMRVADLIYYNLIAKRIMEKQGWDKRRIVTLFYVNHGNRIRTYYIEQKKENILYG